MSTSDARLFPLFADLRGRCVVVVGAGAVAARKIEPLLAAGAQVQVVADALGERVARWAAEQKLRWSARQFREGVLDSAWLVVVATDDAELNRQVAAAAAARRLFANVVDDVELSSYQSPAVVDRAPLQIAVSSGGAAPVLARQVRARIEALLEDHLGDLAHLLHAHRREIRSRLPELGARRRFLEGMLGSAVEQALAAGDNLRASRELRRALRQAETTPSGWVSIVGAGPGDPGLLTLKAQRCLQQADVILHDRLVTPEVLALARRDAELIETGKQAGNHHTSQERIHELLLEHARSGRRVVRLKGGDPFVFGRGGEEIEFLRDHGIGYEVVPGITAALACAAYAGIPLTHREHAQSVRLVTAHCRDSLDTLDWQALAAERQTLAVYMGVAGLDTLRTQLLAHGRAGDTPIALIENGSRPQQRVVLGSLATLPERAREFDVRSPALLIIGEVAALAAQLHWFGDAPLGGKAIGANTLAAAA